MLDSETHQYIQTMRLHLLDMARISQRCIEICVKALQLGTAGNCAEVRGETYYIENLYRDVVNIAAVLVPMEQLSESDFSFALASMRIAEALQSIQSGAAKALEQSVYLSWFGGNHQCIPLSKFAEADSELMRLCVDALSAEEVEPAKRVLDAFDGQRSFATDLYRWYRTIDPDARLGAKYALEIGKYLRQMARQIVEVSDAIVFWMEYGEAELPATENGVLLNDCL